MAVTHSISNDGRRDLPPVTAAVSASGSRGRTRTCGGVAAPPTANVAASVGAAGAHRRPRSFPRFLSAGGALPARRGYRSSIRWERAAGSPELPGTGRARIFSPRVGALTGSAPILGGRLFAGPVALSNSGPLNLLQQAAGDLSDGSQCLRHRVRNRPREAKPCRKETRGQNMAPAEGHHP